MREKEIFYKIHSTSFGDTIAATPTLRRLFYAYNQRVNVITHSKKCFANNPYVKRLLSFDEFDSLFIEGNSEIEILESFVDAGRKNERGVEKKFATIDLRNSHSMDLGFELTPDQREYDFFPEEYSGEWDLPPNYVVLHVTSNWANRTWSMENWQSLVSYLAEKKIFTVTIGMDYVETLHGSVSSSPLVKKCPVFDNIYGLDLTNKGSLDDMWHVINRSDCIVTMDSGPLHLAGCTDSYIIQLGSALDWRFRAPYRNGTQNYKYRYIGGTCSIFCNNDLIYSVREWGTINSTPPLDGCLERKKIFECHPTSDNVIREIESIFPVEDKKILNSDFKRIHDSVEISKQKETGIDRLISLKEDGEFVSFNFLEYIDGEIRFSIREDLEGELRIECFDYVTGLRRDVQTYENPKNSGDGYYWWVPSPGNDSDIKKQLGPIRLDIYETGHKRGEILIPEEGGTELIVGNNKIQFPKIDDNLYPTFWEIFVKQEYDFPRGVKENGVIVDIGANYGFYSLFAIDRFSPSEVHLIEPNPNCHSNYQKIFGAFDLCKFYQLAVTEKSTTYSIENESGISAISRMKEDPLGDIKGETISDLLGKIQGDIEILKIDCEGDEVHIFDQIKEEDLSRIYHIGVEYHSNDIRNKILGKLESSGFVCNVNTTSDSFGIILASRNY